ncbi:alpha/beta fold hydrolase [Geoglobus acetivorans]|uniref:Alpha/beta fold hydrolase n=1 Tax=Geoglobus acetivorans TaxID=565033 RepID=A0ABZ3H1D1_GEOAI|nr:alpha/beta fold hydrolase [Geoglobus acetivorans]
MKLDLMMGRNHVRLNVDEAVIICHGLPYEQGSAIDKSYDLMAEFFSKRGIAAVVFDFSGTGKSKGDFSLLSWQEDLEYLVDNFERVHLVGFSMGGVIAYCIDNADTYSIIASPFSTRIFEDGFLEDIYSNAILKRTLRGLESLESFKKKFKEEFEILAPENSIPKRNVLVVHGEHDEIVPFEEGTKLFRHAKRPKKFVNVKNGDHFLRKHRKVLEVVYSWIVEKREGESVESITL